MDILYIVGGPTNTDRLDLRCSLRSIAQFAKGIDRVIVAGDCPEWLSDSVIRVPYKQPYPIPKNMFEKHRNMQQTLRFVAINTELSEDFILASDDHFLTKTIDFAEYPYYVKLANDSITLPKHGYTEYNKELASTRAFLELHELPVYYMTMHRNMRMKRSAVIACDEMFDDAMEMHEHVEPYAAVGNYMVRELSITPKPIRDYKIFNGSDWWKSRPEVTDTFSIISVGLGWTSTLLLSKYPNKCIYEK